MKAYGIFPIGIQEIEGEPDRFGQFHAEECFFGMGEWGESREDAVRLAIKVHLKQVRDYLGRIEKLILL